MSDGAYLTTTESAILPHSGNHHILLTLKIFKIFKVSFSSMVSIAHEAGLLTSEDGVISAPEGSIITEDGSLVAADGTILAPPGSVVAAEDTSHQQQHHQHHHHQVSHVSVTSGSLMYRGAPYPTGSVAETEAFDYARAG